MAFSALRRFLDSRNSHLVSRSVFAGRSSSESVGLGHGPARVPPILDGALSEMGASGISTGKLAGVPGTDPPPSFVDRPASVLSLTFFGAFGLNVAERLVTSCSHR